MRAIIITQEDRFVIPLNIDKVASLENVDIVEIIVLDSPGSLKNLRGLFFKGFGVLQSVRMATILMLAYWGDLLDAFTGWRLLNTKLSIRAVARRRKIPFRVTNDINAPDSLKTIRDLNPDVIISFSAPTIFKPALLAIPRHGCVNLHCSYLPQYAGLLPSFWVLYKGESATGATVHYMDNNIDNGDILAQTVVPIEAGVSMFSLIKKTKQVGGDLVCRVLTMLCNGETITAYVNPSQTGSYYSWPTVEQMREFRARGGRLI